MTQISTAKLELITPEYARELLELNTRNRPVRAAWVKELAEIIKAGNFETNSDAIAIDTNNTLTNGQHRLLAVIEAGIAVYMWVIRGVAPESFEITDVGRLRKITDFLASAGE